MDIQIARKILDEIRNNQDGITKEELIDKLEIDETQLNLTMEKLVNKKFVKIEDTKNGERKFFPIMENERETDRKIKDLNENERLIYQLIKEAGAEGTNSTDLTKNSKLKSVAKICSSLEQKGLIKDIKPVGKNKKLWFLKEITPNEKSTDLLSIEQPKLLESICDKTYYIIDKEECLAFDEILKNLRKGGEELKDADLTLVLNSLIFGDKIEEIKNKGTQKNKTFFKTSNWDFIEPSFMNSPCGSCPVINECKPGYKISPENCIYFEKW